MPSEPLPRQSLRRSCHACARLKLRCDQRLPKCTRCVAKGSSCEYINTPWGLKSRSKSTALSEHDRKGGIGLTPSLHLEIQKTFSGVIIQFLVDGMRSFPESFARERKTAFIHPDVCRDMNSGSSCCQGLIEDVHGLCTIYGKGLHAYSMHILRQKSTEIQRRATRASSFEELLICVQSLILTHSVLFFDDSQGYSESTSAMLTNLARRLWQQAPVHLPQGMSPRKAWLFAESVRRTIITAYMLCSTYSFRKRRFSVRTPFVEALPFDERTSFWDDEGGGCEGRDVQQMDTFAMVSLREYSNMLETGHVHGISFFGSLILAACKGIPASKVQFPPLHGYQRGLLS